MWRLVGFALMVALGLTVLRAVAEEEESRASDGEPTPWATVRANLTERSSKKLPFGLTDQEGRQIHQQVPAAIEAALRWLAAHQSPDGRWEAAGFNRWCDGEGVPEEERADGCGLAIYDVGVTALALSAFLVAGYTGSGQHGFDGTVSRGIAYLLQAQDDDGCFGSRVVSPVKQSDRYEGFSQKMGDEEIHGFRPVPYAGVRKTFVYNHAIATLAVVEAHGLTGSEASGRAAQRGLDFIARARNPDSAWRYGVRTGESDTSVTGWMMLTILTAQCVNRACEQAGRSAPFTLDGAAYAGIQTWIRRVSDRDYGCVGYADRSSASSRPWELIDRFPSDKSESMTAVGVLAQVFLGEDPLKNRLVSLGAERCVKLPPTWNDTDGSIDMIYWHFGHMAMFQAGGALKRHPNKARKRWYAWLKAVEMTLVGNQSSEGTLQGVKGSWDPRDPWGGVGGRVYSTAINTLTLLTPLRFQFLGK